MSPSSFIVRSSFTYCILLLLLLHATCISSTKTDNINGYYAVKKGWHYANKTAATWGQNGEKSFSVRATLPVEAAVYNCANTTEYSCEDPIWYYDWNKLWGKARCGYLHDHHEDSDRFVFRRCSDASCSSFDSVKNIPSIQIAAYSYDFGVAPYTGENPGLLKEFKTVVYPDNTYRYVIDMFENGTSVFSLYEVNADGTSENFLESEIVQHSNTCTDNYYEGTIDGLYFGGTCTAPIEIAVLYTSTSN